MHAQVTITLKAEQVHQFTMELGERIIVGRGRDCGLRIRGEMISRHHAKVEFDYDGVHVTDTSKNGSFLDEKRMEPERPIFVAPGRVVRMGEHEFTFEVVSDVGSGDLRLPKELDELEDEYEFLSRVQGKGDGRVWAARHKGLKRTVAVKLAPERVKPGSDEALRMQREAQLCCRINSPHIARLHDYRIVGEFPLLIMELVPGPSAADRLKAKGPYPVGEALKIGAHIALALEAASRFGVVHRDVCPKNVFVDRHGDAKLSNFGIAKQMGNPSITKTGLTLGSLSYMSPEQTEDSRQVDGRSDIFSLGATLYHLIGGKPPFLPADMGDDSWEAATLSQLRPDCPGPVERYVMQMLAIEADARPQDAGEVARELQGLRQRLYPEDDPLLETHHDD